MIYTYIPEPSIVSREMGVYRALINHCVSVVGSLQSKIRTYFPSQKKKKSSKENRRKGIGSTYNVQHNGPEIGWDQLGKVI